MLSSLPAAPGLGRLRPGEDRLAAPLSGRRATEPAQQRTRARLPTKVHATGAFVPPLLGQKMPIPAPREANVTATGAQIASAGK
ncbi:hypothetical protein [Rhizorhapis sp. SPR117]|uniref:hypothetical protein n=1 Tax=Rhizorhapis sp. SPR117 TaxID=2912611 RepID=UPI0007701AAD|nr:hypothetical protein K426_11345 [Sphingobium sp. TKS]MCF8710021.1 hypothetical protein [Rhizorhapis sp. SPR117]